MNGKLWIVMMVLILTRVAFTTQPASSLCDESCDENDLSSRSREEDERGMKR